MPDVPEQSSAPWNGGPSERWYFALSVAAAVASIGSFVAQAASSKSLPAWVSFGLAALLLVSGGVLILLARRLRSLRQTNEAQSQVLQRYQRQTILYRNYDASVLLVPAEDVYKLRFLKRIHNIGAEELRSLDYHVDCNRYPDDEERDRQIYVDQPLTAEGIRLKAWDEIGPLDIEIRSQRGNRVAFVVLLAESGVPRPIFPGDERTVEYSYQVPTSHWGPYFNRPVYNPVDHLEVKFSCPSDLHPRVALAEVSETSKRPMNVDPMTKTVGDDLVETSFTIPDPAIGTTYQLSWHTDADDRGTSPGFPPDLPGAGPQS